MTLISGRALYYDELNEDTNTKLTSSEEEDFKSQLSNILNDNDDDIDDNNDLSFDSYEEKKFHQRQISSDSQDSNTVSPHTREAIMDILQKAFDQGWRPNLKHYIPATRFGRHRR
ncbi:unnamed protein product [Rotaria sp. Silwood2]|nr:unnamed protein product [Rotaria sp. Silwood2]CAF2718755.1 unnamed protein product [Rotaria sp. Silwood2]CAF2870990.1 unnamed protein product [Rotaria sp. Silwood2]CAF3199651.1 unnamed protein product [Rotaria sp. Silwood2]CAF3881099.1 unnamed protein product [Rotaria sp. Silwood2]